MKRVGTAIKRKLETMEIEVGSTSSSDETLHASTKKSSKIQILTILPKSWTRKTIVEKFGATDYMVRRAKELAREKGILATPNPKTSGRTLSDQTVELVKEWYRSDEISRVMPGMKDFVSVKIGDTRMHVQKRLILCNLREVYARRSMEMHKLVSPSLLIYDLKNVFLLGLVAHTQYVYAQCIRTSSRCGSVPSLTSSRWTTFHSNHTSTVWLR